MFSWSCPSRLRQWNWNYTTYSFRNPKSQAKNHSSVCYLLFGVRVCAGTHPPTPNRPNVFATSVKDDHLVATSGRERIRLSLDDNFNLLWDYLARIASLDAVNSSYEEKKVGLVQEYSRQTDFRVEDKILKGQKQIQNCLRK